MEVPEGALVDWDNNQALGMHTGVEGVRRIGTVVLEVVGSCRGGGLTEAVRGRAVVA